MDMEDVEANAPSTTSGNEKPRPTESFRATNQFMSMSL